MSNFDIVFKRVKLNTAGACKAAVSTCNQNIAEFGYEFVGEILFFKHVLIVLVIFRSIAYNAEAIILLHNIFHSVCRVGFIVKRIDGIRGLKQQ